MIPNQTDKIRLDSLFLTHCVRTDEGFLKAPAVVTRAGIFEYRRSDGSMRRELRRPEQVFRSDSMSSLHNIPFVDEHPYKDGGEVTSRNARRLSRGYSGSPAYKDGDKLCVDVIVTDEDAIKAIEAGKISLSAGYKVNTLETPGEWEGQRYDAEQVDIRYNHIASVKKGRAGKEAVLRLDENLDANILQETDMVKIKLDDGKTVEVDEAVAEAFSRLGKRADEAERLFVESDSKAETLKGENDGLKARLDEATKEELINARVAERVSLVTSAQAILPKAEHVKLDSMKNVEIMQAVIRQDAGEPEMKFDGFSDERIQGRFDQVLAGRKAKKVGDGGLGKKILEGRRQDAGGSDDEGAKSPEEMAKERKDRLVNRYKTPISEKKK